MDSITLKQLSDIILSLPEDVQGAKISYLDLGYVEEERIEAFKEDMIESFYDRGDIGVCCN